MSDGHRWGTESYAAVLMIGIIHFSNMIFFLQVFLWDSCLALYKIYLYFHDGLYVIYLLFIEKYRRRLVHIVSFQLNPGVGLHTGHVYICIEWPHSARPRFIMEYRDTVFTHLRILGLFYTYLGYTGRCLYRYGSRPWSWRLWWVVLTSWSFS